MYTPEEVAAAKEKIIAGIYEGKSLKSIIDNDLSIPSRVTVYQWFNEAHAQYDEVFLNNHLRARRDSADIDVDKMEVLNQEVRDGTVTPQAARIIADNLKWTAGRKQPKKYGDKLDLTSDNEKLPSASVVILPRNDRDDPEDNSDLM